MKTTLRKSLSTATSAVLVALLSLTPLSGCGGGCAGGGGAAGLVDKLPAAANGVVLIDLDTLLSADVRQKIRDVAGKEGADVSKFPEWAMKIKSVAVVANWTEAKGPEPSMAAIMTGDFDAAAVAKELEGLVKKEASVSAVGANMVLLGQGMMYEAAKKSSSGEGDTLSKNEGLATLLSKVDRGATFVMAGQDIKKMGAAVPFVEDISVSYDLSSGLAIKAWAKGDEAMFKKAEEAVPMLKMGMSMMDKDKLAPMMAHVPGLDPNQLGPLIEAAKEFVDSLEVTVSGGTIAASAKTSFDVKGFMHGAVEGMRGAFSTYMKRAQQAPTLNKTDKL